MPSVDLAAQVVERHPRRFKFILELQLDAAGAAGSTNILLDDGGPEQKVLAQLKGRD